MQWHTIDQFLSDELLIHSFICMIISLSDLVWKYEWFKQDWILSKKSGALVALYLNSILFYWYKISKFSWFLSCNFSLSLRLSNMNISIETEHASKRTFYNQVTVARIEFFDMTSRRPYWCPKTMKRQPRWCPKPVLWELNSFLIQTLSFVPINLHRCWLREWKRSIAHSSFTVGNEAGVDLVLIQLCFLYYVNHVLICYSK